MHSNEKSVSSQRRLNKSIRDFEWRTINKSSQAEKLAVFVAVTDFKILDR